MNSPPKCPKCSGEMNEGFILDHGYGESYPATWVAGKPERGFLGLKVRGKEQHPIRSFCCQKCGYVEAYVSRE